MEGIKCAQMGCQSLRNVWLGLSRRRILIKVKQKTFVYMWEVTVHFFILWLSRSLAAWDNHKKPVLWCWRGQGDEGDECVIFRLWSRSDAANSGRLNFWALRQGESGNTRRSMSHLLIPFSLAMSEKFPHIFPMSPCTLIWTNNGSKPAE